MILCGFRDFWNPQGNTLGNTNKYSIIRHGGILYARYKKASDKIAERRLFFCTFLMNTV
nr:MAG TPA: hypothetical protein [Siphoviridae sp. ctnoo6]